MRIGINNVDEHTAPGSEFKAYTACTAEHIQNLHLFKINQVSQNIKQAFLCKISRWPATEVAACADNTAFVFTTDYSQLIRFNRLKYFDSLILASPSERSIPSPFISFIPGIYSLIASR